jgi:hypothetical protein
MGEIDKHVGLDQIDRERPRVKKFRKADVLCVAQRGR